MGRVERQKRRSKTECGLRVVSGDIPGLGARWTHGIGDLQPGRITLTPFIGGVRLLKKKSVRVDVVRVDRYGQRTTALKEAIFAMPGMTVVQAHTPEAILDWILHPEIAAWAAAAITPETS